MHACQSVHVHQVFHISRRIDHYCDCICLVICLAVSHQVLVDVTDPCRLSADETVSVLRIRHRQDALVTLPIGLFGFCFFKSLDPATTPPVLSHQPSQKSSDQLVEASVSLGYVKTLISIL